MKATFPDGTLFEGTPEEFNAIREHGHAPTGGNGMATANRLNGTPRIWSAANARTFWESLDPQRKGGKQKRLLQFLIGRGGRASHDEVAKHLDIKSGQALAGVLANISRNARRETNYTKALAVDWDYSGKGSYFIPRDLLELLKLIE
jgi:hypothetical protein